MEVVREGPSHEKLPLLAHPGWRERFPWLVQGITGRGAPDRPFDLRLFGPGPSGPALERWERLGRTLDFARLVHARQVHGARVVFHRDSGPGLLLVGKGDGHATDRPGILLTVSLADCVPVYLVGPALPAVALLHAGWRGTAAGILERGLAVLEDRLALSPGDLHLHLGPAICGDCYEVGPEVHEALGGDRPGKPEPVDLRADLAARAARRGVPTERISVSELCTRCGDGGLFSHRGGDEGRQVGYLGIRPAAPG